MFKRITSLLALLAFSFPLIGSAMGKDCKVAAKKDAQAPDQSILTHIQARIDKQNKEKMAALGLDKVPSAPMKDLIEVDRLEKQLFALLRADLIKDESNFKKNFEKLDEKTRQRMATMRPRFSDDKGADCGFMKHKDHGLICHDETNENEDLALAMLDLKKRTLLHYAGIFCLAPDIRLLLDAQANPLHCDATQSTPFYCSIKAFDDKSVALFLERLPNLLVPIHGQQDALSCLADEAHWNRSAKNIKLMQAHMQKIVDRMHAAPETYSVADITHSVGNALAVATDESTYNSTTITLLTRAMPDLLQPIKFLPADAKTSKPKDTKKSDVISCLAMLAQKPEIKSDKEAELDAKLRIADANEIIDSIRDHIRSIFETMQKDPKKYSKNAIVTSLSAAHNQATQIKKNIAPEVKEDIKKYLAVATLECANKTVFGAQATAAVPCPDLKDQDLPPQPASTQSAAQEIRIEPKRLSKKERSAFKAAREKAEEEAQILRVKLLDQKLQEERAAFALQASKDAKAQAAAQKINATPPAQQAEPVNSTVCVQAARENGAPLQAHELAAQSIENEIETQKMLALVHSQKSRASRSAGKSQQHAKKKKDSTKKADSNAPLPSMPKKHAAKESTVEREEREAREREYKLVNAKLLELAAKKEALKNEEARVQAQKKQEEKALAEKEDREKQNALMLKEQREKERVAAEVKKKADEDAATAQLSADFLAEYSARRKERSIYKNDQLAQLIFQSSQQTFNAGDPKKIIS